MFVVERLDVVLEFIGRAIVDRIVDSVTENPLASTFNVSIVSIWEEPYIPSLLLFNKWLNPCSGPARCT